MIAPLGKKIASQASWLEVTSSHTAYTFNKKKAGLVQMNYAQLGRFTTLTFLQLVQGVSLERFHPPRSREQAPC